MTSLTSGESRRRSARLANRACVSGATAVAKPGNAVSKDSAQTLPDRLAQTSASVLEKRKRKRGTAIPEPDASKVSEESPSSNIKSQAGTVGDRPDRRKRPVHRGKADEEDKGAENHLKSENDTGSGQQKFWLFKSEPESRIANGKDVKFSIDDLRECTAPEPWSGVRNYLARNNMMAMKKGDLAFFYHSNTKTPGIVGICEVMEEASVDETAFDPKDPYYDPKSDRESPRWFCVKVKFHSKFGNVISLSDLQTEAKKPGSPLREMQVATMRRAASVSAVTKEEWEWIMAEMRTDR